MQSAYRILVAASEGDLEAEENLLWDSGRVESGRTIGIEYEGEALRSGSQCVWKVRVWDGANNPSPYSSPAGFEMGLLERSDWKGAWISAGKCPAGDLEPPSGDEYDDLANGLAPSPYLRREFPLDKTVRRARLYATARGVYELLLNGTRVGDDVLAPGWTDYHRRVQYQTYDVTPLLAEGQNALGAVLGDGWFAGFVGFDPKHRGAHYGPRPQLLAQLNVEYEDGTQGEHRDRRLVEMLDGPILFSDLLMGEAYDARREMPGWAAPGFDDSAWYGVAAEEIGDTDLVAQPDEGIRVTEELEAKTVTEPRAAVTSSTWAQNMVGWVRLKVEGEAGTEVHPAPRRGAQPRRHDYTTNLRSARATDRYVLGGEGEEIYEPRFTFHGFRYVEVTGYPGEPPLGGDHRPRRPLRDATDGVLRVLRARWSTSCRRTSSGASAATSSACRPTARSATNASAGRATPRSSSAPPPSTWTSPPSSRSGWSTSRTPSPRKAPSPTWPRC